MSTLVIDTIQGKTTAGSVNVRGEGSNNTNLQQGLNKLWVNLNGTAVDGTSDLTGVRDSFATASVVDNGTGDHTINFTNNMNNNTYVIGSHTQRNASVTENSICSSYQNNYNNAHNTGFFRISTNRPDIANDEDVLTVMLSLLGDLA